MPTYQYRCTACGNEIERVQKFSDPALTVCEDCGGQLRKIYNAVGIVFKGSGFYATDNRTKGSASAASSSEPAKGESKPAESSSSTSSATSTSTPASSSGTPTSSSSTGSSSTGSSSTGSAR